MRVKKGGGEGDNGRRLACLKLLCSPSSSQSWPSSTGNCSALLEAHNHGVLFITADPTQASASSSATDAPSDQNQRRTVALLEKRDRRSVSDAAEGWRFVFADRTSFLVAGAGRSPDLGKASRLFGEACR